MSKNRSKIDDFFDRFLKFIEKCSKSEIFFAPYFCGRLTFSKKVHVILLRNREKPSKWAKNNSLISFNLKIAESVIASIYLDSDLKTEKKPVFGHFSRFSRKTALFAPPGMGPKMSVFSSAKKNQFLFTFLCLL